MLSNQQLSKHENYFIKNTRDKNFIILLVYGNIICWNRIFLQVYNGVWKEKSVVIKCGLEDGSRQDGSPDSMLRQEMTLFNKPSRGTSMDEFREMLQNFLKVFSLVISTGNVKTNVTDFIPDL